MMKVVNLLIKPASSECNLQCRYCFYHELANNRNVKSYGKMTYDTMEVLVKEAFASATEAVVFAFQGGEPTLAGLDFYRDFLDLVKKYHTNNVSVNYSLQTNGLLLDEQWCQFFKTNGFLIGISLDGPKSIHDSLRYDRSRSGSFDCVLHSINLLKQFNVEYNILTVISRANYDKGENIYKFFQNEGFLYLQFIPCLDSVGFDNCLALDAKSYEEFLNQVFSLWYQDMLENKPVSIRYFDNLIGIILGYQAQSCDLRDHCAINLIVESNGDIYPCDFYVTDSFRLGNIKEEHLTAIYEKDLLRKFVQESSINEKCKTCRYYLLCRGGCRRHRHSLLENAVGENRFCQAYYQFLDKNIKKLEHLAFLFANK